jgi:hypothetical protein
VVSQPGEDDRVVVLVIVVQLDDMIAIGEDLYSPHRLEGRLRF